ncbi:MAG: hypothetical protein M5T61_02220 [Acidimicrobiia bacterium]|nr:hypothetical protein [Acidimicrobiia bacterium]
MRRALGPLIAASILLSAAPAEATPRDQTPRPRDRFGSAATTVVRGSGSREARITAYTSGYTRDFACGFLLAYDCATVKDIYGSMWVRRVGRRAQNPNLMKISTTAGFEGVGLSVSVMAPTGVAVGFVDAGSSCRSPVLEALPRASRVSFRADGEICKAKTAGWVSAVTVSTNGYYRYGSGWRVVTATYRRTVGGI